MLCSPSLRRIRIGAELGIDSIRKRDLDQTLRRWCGEPADGSILPEDIGGYRLASYGLQEHPRQRVYRVPGIEGSAALHGIGKRSSRDHRWRQILADHHRMGNHGSLERLGGPQEFTKCVHRDGLWRL